MRLSKQQWDELVASLVNGFMTPGEAAQAYGVSQQAISFQLKKRPYAHRVVRQRARDRARGRTETNPDPRTREIERRWKESGDDRSGWALFRALSRAQEWSAGSHPDLFWFLLSQEGGPEAMVAAARSLSRAGTPPGKRIDAAARAARFRRAGMQDWELHPESYVFLRAYQMGRLGRVAAYDAVRDDEHRFYVAAARRQPRLFPEEAYESAVPLPGSDPPLYLVEQGKPKAAGRPLKSPRGQRLINPTEWESVRIMQAVPRKRDMYGYTDSWGEYRWKNNPDEGLREWERAALQGDFQAAVLLEIGRARARRRCPCEQSCPPEMWADHAYAEVFRDFDEHGGYRPGPGVSPNPGEPLLTEEEVRRACAENDTISGAAREIHTSPGTLKKYAKMYKVPLPKRKKRPKESPEERKGRYKREARERREAKRAKAEAPKPCPQCRRPMVPRHVWEALPSLEKAYVEFYKRGHRVCSECSGSPVTRVSRKGRSPGQRHGVTKTHSNPDEPARRAQRQAFAGDAHAEARWLRSRLRARTILPEAVRLAAYLGYVPAQLAIDWTPPEPPFGSPDDVMLCVAQDNEWGHRMAALWAYALVKGTEWIWNEANGHTDHARPGYFPAISMAPDNAIKLIEVFLEAGAPCPEATTHPRQLQLHGFRERLGDVVYELDRASFDAQEDEDPREYLLAEAAAQWVKALTDALTIWGPNVHPSWSAALWGNRQTIGTRWVGYPNEQRTGVPLYARQAREAYRQAVWAVDYYRGGMNRPKEVMDKAQLDVEAWTRKIMLPEVLA